MDVVEILSGKVCRRPEAIWVKSRQIRSSAASDVYKRQDKMTYRTNPHTGDKVSLLGYGCMRWPLRQKADGSGEEID